MQKNVQAAHSGFQYDVVTRFGCEQVPGANHAPSGPQGSSTHSTQPLWVQRRGSH
eukprot:m.362756 g.362756  ORF g.362756 m.362756 type:complete len:55 (+) comp19962_c0_seq3:522-686(+)